jgi:hypothetical protein
MRWTPLSLILPTLLGACDLNEGPREERREAVEAARDGRSTDAVQEQVEDLTPARSADHVAVERDFERDLRKTENWAERVRRDLASGGKEADEQFERSFAAIEHDLLQIRQEFDRLGERSEGERQRLTESLRERLRELRLRVDALDGEVDDQPGADPQGPG